MHLLLGNVQNDRESSDVGNVAETSELPQRILRIRRQPRQPLGQELHDIVCVAFGVNRSKLPCPLRLLVVEGQETLFSENVKKLDHEERIAVGLRAHQLCERIALLNLAAERIRDEAAQI